MAQKKSSKNKQATKQEKPKKKSGELTTGQKVIIVVFIVIFAFSTLASALASVFSSSNSSSDTEETTVETIDEQYQSIVDELEAKVAEDSSDTTSLLALGRYYYQWGASAKSYASTDDETSHVNELFEKAISYYDQYLELEDSDAVRVDQAMCKYYEDDTTGAIQLLENVTESNPDYALAWYNLGAMYYYAQGDSDAAKEALNMAIEKDPDDEYSAKTNAESLLSSIESAEEEAEESTDTDSSTSDTSSSDTSSSTTDTSTSDTSSSSADSTDGE